MTSHSFRLWLVVVALTVLTVVLTLVAGSSGHLK